MKHHLAASLLALTALAVTACDDGRQMQANSRLCADFKTAKGPVVNPTDGATAVDDCAKRWAYSLAGGRDDATVVAEAVANACNLQLTRWNQQAVAQPNGDEEAVSIITGEPTSALAEHNSFTHNRALFYVVQARAGRCPAPPIKDGVPEGLS